MLDDEMKHESATTFPRVSWPLKRRYIVTMKENNTRRYEFFLIFCIVNFATGIPSQKQKNDHLLDHNLVILPLEDYYPKFVPPVQNTTVTIGHNALLACIVDNLQEYKVSWVRESTQTVLTIHQMVTTTDSRISLSYNDHRSWYLHLRDVKEEDRGWYRCQINTDPVTSQSVYLEVLIPPKIIDEETTSDLVVRELSDVTLQCKATGYPEPYVIWRRADGNDFQYGGEKVNVVDGEKLHFTKISRLHMGTYFCVAQNGISPTLNRKITLTVHFPPILHIPNQLVGATPNQKVTLLCISEAYPKSINYWTKGNGEMLSTDEKYEIVYKHDMYTTNMMITIQKVRANDYTTFTCVSINPLGITDGIIKLYELIPPVEYELKLHASMNENENNTGKEFTVNLTTSLNSTSSTTSCKPRAIDFVTFCTLGQISFHLAFLLAHEGHLHEH